MAATKWSQTAPECPVFAGAIFCNFVFTTQISIQFNFIVVILPGREKCRMITKHLHVCHEYEQQQTQSTASI